MALQGLGRLSWAYVLQTVRSRTALVWNIVFPVFWLLLFGFVFAGSEASDTTAFMPGLFTITILAGSFFGVSYLMVMERETGVLRRYRVTPVSALTVVLANVCRALLMLVFSVAVQGLVGWLIFDIYVVGSLAELVVAMLVGTCAFIPLGLIVGSVASDMRTAPAISNVIFLPLAFGTGAAIPFWILPWWVQAGARLLPSAYLVEALQGVMVRGETLLDVAGPLAVLAVTAVVGAALNGLLFRWEPEEPVRVRRLVAALVVLAVVLAGAALFAPDFEMTRRPSIMGSAAAESAGGDCDRRTAGRYCPVGEGRARVDGEEPPCVDTFVASPPVRFDPSADPSGAPHPVTSPRRSHPASLGAARSPSS